MTYTDPQLLDSVILIVVLALFLICLNALVDRAFQQMMDEEDASNK